MELDGWVWGLLLFTLVATRGQRLIRAALHFCLAAQQFYEQTTFRHSVSQSVIKSSICEWSSNSLQRESVVETSFGRALWRVPKTSALWLLLYIDFFLLCYFDRKSHRNFGNKTKSSNVYCRQLESLNNEPHFMSYIFCGGVSVAAERRRSQGLPA